jgi:hypothetical protein
VALRVGAFFGREEMEQRARIQKDLKTMRKNEAEAFR